MVQQTQTGKANVIRGDDAGEVFVATTVQTTAALDDTQISNGIVHGDLA